MSLSYNFPLDTIRKEVNVLPFLLSSSLYYGYLVDGGHSVTLFDRPNVYRRVTENVGHSVPARDMLSTLLSRTSPLTNRGVKYPICRLERRLVHDVNVLRPFVVPFLFCPRRFTTQGREGNQ